MNPTSSNSNAIVKQELIIDDLKEHDYEHLLQEFYYEAPVPDENQHDSSGEGWVLDDVPDPKEATSSSSIQLALDVEPDLDGTWHCPVCPTSFKWRILFVIHVKNHFRCDACNLSYTTKTAYDQHNQLEHGFIFPPTLSTNQVPTGRVSTEADRCVSHSISEELTRPLESENSRSSDGQEHDLPCLAVSTDLPSSVIVKEEFVLKEQGEVYKNDTQIKRPKSGQRCPECEAWYLTVAGLGKHLLRHHAKPLMNRKKRDEDRVPTKKELYCGRCDKTFASQFKFTCHQKRHTNIDAGRFKCHCCLKSSASKQELVVHKSRNHLTNPLKTSGVNLLDLAKPCTIVPEDILPRQESKELSSNHRECKGRPKGSRRCTVCKQWFLTEAELRDHFSIHSGKSFAYCALCDKNFSTFACFKVHRMRHRNVKLRRFWCKKCAKAFATKREQNDHKHKAVFGRKERVQKVGRSQVNRKCPMCQVRFRSVTKFKDHIGSHIHG